MPRQLTAGLVALVALMGSIGWRTAAEAQEGGMDAFVQESPSEVNQGVVRIVAGEWGSTSLRIASDLAAVLDRRGALRILPIVGKGSVQNITDLLYLKGIDLCIVQADVLDFVVRNRIHASTERRVRYITKLHNEEFHLLVRRDIRSFEDLAGKEVGFGPMGSGSAVTATTAFEILNMSVQPRYFDHALALDKLRAGEIAGMAYTTGKPAAFFNQIDAAAGLHFVSVPITGDLLTAYAPSLLRRADYPRLIGEGEIIETIAVGAVLAVYNWAPDADRYGQTAQFVEALFGNFDVLLDEPRHPKWQEVNLAATVPAWTRFAAAQDWLDRHATGALELREGDASDTSLAPSGSDREPQRTPDRQQKR